MNSIGPLLITFIFFALLFLFGKHLQRREQKGRTEKDKQFARIVVEQDVTKKPAKTPPESGQGQSLGLGQTLAAGSYGEPGQNLNTH